MGFVASSFGGGVRAREGTAERFVVDVPDAGTRCKPGKMMELDEAGPGFGLRPIRSSIGGVLLSVRDSKRDWRFPQRGIWFKAEISRLPANMIAY